MKKILLLYIPVIHQGYLDLFARHSGDVDELIVVGSTLIEEFFPLHKEIRAVSPGMIPGFIKSLTPEKSLFKDISIINIGNIKPEPDEIITTREVIHEKLIAKYFPNAKVTYDTAFLRWDESNVCSSVAVNCDRVSEDVFDQQMIELARKESDKSSDWWRHIGALLVKNGEILFETHNTHLPSKHTPYIDGDPRDFVQAGTNPEIRSAIHAEPRIIAEAARMGISVEGCDIYLTTFPCTPCAEIIACAGIKRLFFVSENAYVNAESVLKSAGVEIIFVQM